MVKKMRLLTLRFWSLLDTALSATKKAQHHSDASPTQANGDTGDSKYYLDQMDIYGLEGIIKIITKDQTAYKQIRRAQCAVVYLLIQHLLAGTFFVSM